MDARPFLPILVTRLITVPEYKVAHIRKNWRPYTIEHYFKHHRRIDLPKKITKDQPFFDFLYEHFGCGRLIGYRWVPSRYAFYARTTGMRRPDVWLTNLSPKLFLVDLHRVGDHVFGYFEYDHRLRVLWRRWRREFKDSQGQSADVEEIVETRPRLRAQRESFYS
jgi:hypothetical protein